jgi:FkbM family methyltransferase
MTAPDRRLVAPVRLESGHGVAGLRRRLVGWCARSAFLAVKAGRGGRQSERITLRAGRLLGSGGKVRFRLAGGRTLVVSSTDRYWLRQLLFDREYEPEIDGFVTRTVTAEDAFVDCGANIGLWSVAVSDVIRDPNRIVAVESAVRTVQQLHDNWDANHRPFTIVPRALGVRDDELVHFYSSATDPASSSTVKESAPADSLTEDVLTISLPTLLASQRSASDRRPGVVFVKLDVEGIEQHVLRSLDPRTDDDVIVIYEDHGRDTRHLATAAALAIGFTVAFIEADGGLRPVPSSSLADLDALKSNPYRGYNLVAFAAEGPAARRIAASAV